MEFGFRSAECGKLKQRAELKFKITDPPFSGGLEGLGRKAHLQLTTHNPQLTTQSTIQQINQLTRPDSTMIPG
jgi:hypothetical protein